MKLRLTSLAILAAFAGGAQAASSLISNGPGNVAATIHDNGSFDIAGAVGLSYGGVEFVNIDTRSAWWTIETGSPGVAVTPVAQYNAGGFPGSLTVGVGPAAATTMVIGGWSFVQTAALTAPNKLDVSVILTNNTGRAIKDVYYGVGFDPDQSGSGLNRTDNTVNGQGAFASVSAGGWNGGKYYTVTLGNTTSAGADMIEAFVNHPDCCSSVSPSAVINDGVVQAGSQGFFDDSISLAYHYGSIGAGQSVTIGYSYTFAVPEPETYAMFLAGLGLMGAVVRRRTRA